MKKNNTPHRTYLNSLGKKVKDLTAEERREYNRINRKHRYDNDPQFRQSFIDRAAKRQSALRESRDIRFRILSWFRDAKRRSEFLKQAGKKFEGVVACSVDDFIEHIESQWVEGMSWDNWGRSGGKDVWHIDHIIPVADGALCTNHYSNLRPLWACDNYSRSDNNRRRELIIELTLPCGGTERLSFNSVGEFSKTFSYNHDMLKQLLNGDEVIIKRRNMFTKHPYPAGTILYQCSC